MVKGLRGGNQGDSSWFGCLKVTRIKLNPEGGSLVTNTRGRGSSRLGFYIGDSPAAQQAAGLSLKGLFPKEGCKAEVSMRGGGTLYPAGLDCSQRLVNTGMEQ